MLKYRLMLGPVLVLATIGVFWLDELAATLVVGDRTLPAGAVLLIAFCIVLGFASWELARILRENGVLASVTMSVTATLLGLVATSSSGGGGPLIGTAAIGMMLVALLYFSRHRAVEGVVAGTGGVLLSFVYLGVLGGFWVLLRHEHSAWVGLWVLLVTKSCDVGAYFTGRAFGRRKLIEWLSPGKTQEGLAGGVLFAGAIAAGGLWLLRVGGVAPDISLMGAFFLGTAVGMLGQVGDLIASLFKRDAGRKDASGSLPGFGGWLDVVDSPLLVGVVAFWALRLLA